MRVIEKKNCAKCGRALVLFEGGDEYIVVLRGDKECNHVWRAKIHQKKKKPPHKNEEKALETELLKRIIHNEPSLKIKMKEAREPLYLIRYE